MAYRVLLADDSITIQKVVELILSDEDVEIESVSDGLEALECLDRFHPDVVLADIEMPRMNGYELCERIKEDPMTRTTPVILLAGAFESFDENRARAVGAEEFIIKPFDSSDLLGKLKSVRTPSGGAVEEVVQEEAALDVPEPVAPGFPGVAQEGPTVEAGKPEMVVEPVQEGASGETIMTAEVVNEADLLPGESVAEAEAVAEAAHFEGMAPSIEEISEEETLTEEPAEPMAEPIPAEPKPVAPPEPDENVVVSGEDFGDEDLWDAEEIAVSGDFDEDASPAPAPQITPPFAESDISSKPAPSADRAVEETGSVDVQLEKHLGEEPEEPVVQEPVEEETSVEAAVSAEPAWTPPGEETMEHAGESEVTESLAPESPTLEEPSVPEETPVEAGYEPEPEEPLSTPEEEMGGESTTPDEPVSMPEEETPEPEIPEASSPAGRVPDVGIPDRAAIEALLSEKIDRLLPDEAAITAAMEKAISSRISSGFDIESQLNARLEKFEADIRDNIAATVEKQLVPAFTKSVESILWDVIPQSTERLMQDTIKEAVSTAVNEKLASISRETIPGLADSLIAKIIEKIRTG